ncbi:MAG: hypothetical protein K8S14_10555 [Actinomycetia bacterium]|nr:hypothetical protein [Actinomycetes bacterium]
MFIETLFLKNETITSETQVLYKILVIDPEFNLKPQYERMLMVAKKENAMLLQHGYLRNDYLFALNMSMILLIKQYLIDYDVLLSQSLYEFDAAEIMDIREADYMQIVISLYRQFALYKIQSQAQKDNEARANYHEDRI